MAVAVVTEAVVEEVVDVEMEEVQTEVKIEVEANNPSGWAHHNIVTPMERVDIQARNVISHKRDINRTPHLKTKSVDPRTTVNYFSGAVVVGMIIFIRLYMLQLL